MPLADGKALLSHLEALQLLAPPYRELDVRAAAPPRLLGLVPLSRWAVRPAQRFNKRMRP